MYRIGWWIGTDALTLISYPPGRKIWHINLFFQRIKMRLLINRFHFHYVVHENLKNCLIKFGCKKPIYIRPDYSGVDNALNNYPMPIHTKFYGKKLHNNFRVLYFCPSENPKIIGSEYRRWYYGYDIYLELKEYFKNYTDIIFEHVSDRSIPLNSIYPYTDLYIRPNRWDGMPRMILECKKNDIPYIWSGDYYPIEIDNLCPDVNIFIKEILKYYNLSQYAKNNKMSCMR